MPGVLDLRHVWHAARASPRGAEILGRRAVGPGLSVMSAALLGKPLDKSMQVRVRTRAGILTV